jgi:hypothetical protein
MRSYVQAAGGALATGRIAIGAALCVAPSIAVQWAGEDARTPGVRMITRALGARDAALGIGALASARQPSQLRRWLILGGACDAADFAATLAGPPSSARSLVLALAAGAAVTSVAAALVA